jgi:general secretion pathway protein C
VNGKLFDKISKLEHVQLARIAGIAIVSLCMVSILVELYESIALKQRYQLDNVISKAKSKTAPIYKSNTIIDGALFGQKTNSNILSDAKLPTTQLKLSLRGAFTATDPEKASAIIEGNDNITKHYKVGSTLFGQTKLKAVYSDKVILTNNGNLETLYFPKVSSQTAIQQAKKINKSQSGRNKQPAMTEQQRQALIKKRLQELRSKTKR